MKVYEIGDKKKGLERAISINELINLMDELERFNGSTQIKIVDNYYQLKAQLRDMATAELKK